MPAVPSRFIQEVPAELIEEIAGAAPDIGGVRDAAPSTSAWGSSRGSSATRAAARRRQAVASGPALVPRELELLPGEEQHRYEQRPDLLWEGHPNR